MKRFFMSTFLVLFTTSAFGQIRVSINIIRDLAQKEAVTAEDIKSIRSEALKFTDKNGKVTESLQRALYEFEDVLRARFTQEAAIEFQNLVAHIGGTMRIEPNVPTERTSYWQKDPSVLDNYKSTKELPKTADYVIIGAGLVGSSAAINLVSEAQNGKQVVILEMADRPATAASGRNGGNIEMLKESFLKAYRGFVEVQKEILQTIFPSLTNIELNTQSERQSTYLMKFFQANVREIQRTVKEYDIKADISMNGWLRIAESAEEEKGLLAEIEFAKKKLGLEFEHWSPEKIMKETGIHTKYGGRFIKESGNYNPFKYVIEVLKAAIQKGVKLYTSTKVESVQKLQDGTYLVKTNKGDIITKKILAASNVTTRSIFKNMEFIEPRVSHVLSTEHTVNQWKGITVTRQQGDWYGHFPKQSHYIGEDGVARAVFHNGGGFDTPVDYSVVENPPADLHPFSKDIYNEIKANAAVSVPDTKGRPGSRFWWGFMAFTKDRMPIVSFLFENGKLDKNIVVVMADNGYGGSQAAISGKYGVQMLITGEIPKELPDDIFSLKRFYTKIPLFKKGSHCRTVHF